MRMLFGLAVVVSTYVSTRLAHHYFGGKLNNEAWIRTLSKPSQPMLSPDIEAQEKEQETDHYITASAVSAGLSVIGMAVAPPTLTVLNLGVLGYSATPIFKLSEQSLLQERKLRNDFLNSLVILGSVSIGQYFAAAIFAVAFHVGSKLVARTQDYSEKMLHNVFEQRPDRVWISRGEVELEIPLESLDIEDIGIVTTGEVVPVDGVITEGKALIDQQTLTGEALPAEKSEGDPVFASTLVVSGRILVKIEKAGRETLVDQLGSILQNTADFKTQLQLRGEKWADHAAAPLLSMGSMLLPLVGLSSSTALLNSSPGNSLRIFTSLHTRNHLTLASQNGILI